MPLPIMKWSFSRLEVGRSSSMLLPCSVDSPSWSLFVTCQPDILVSFRTASHCVPPPPPSQCVLPPPEGVLHQPGGLSEVLWSRILTAMGGFDCVGSNQAWVKLKMVLSGHTCLVLSQGFYIGTPSASQLWAGLAAGRDPPRVFGINYLIAKEDLFL